MIKKTTKIGLRSAHSNAIKEKLSYMNVFYRAELIIVRIDNTGFFSPPTSKHSLLLIKNS